MKLIHDRQTFGRLRGRNGCIVGRRRRTLPPIEDCRCSCVSAAKGKESRKEVHGDGERGTKNIKWLLRHASGAGIRRTRDKTFRARRWLVSVYLDGKATF